MLWRRKKKASEFAVYDDGETWTTVPPAKPSRTWLHILLFVLTVLSTMFAGAMQKGVNPFVHPHKILYGLPFSGMLLLILGVHEFGHYFASRIWNVKATLPYFIPFPSPIGTIGAFIKIKSPIPNRKALIDIGAAGPLLGSVVALGVLIVGLRTSAVVPVDPDSGRIVLGYSLLSYALSRVVVHAPEGYDILFNSVALAGWLGLFVTALNLLPIGQLDGGHIVYSLFGRRHSIIGRIAIFSLFPLSIFWPGWLLWAFLTIALGRGHPPPYDFHSPLDRKRQLIGVLSILVFVLCFIPVPFHSPGTSPYELWR